MARIGNPQGQSLVSVSDMNSLSLSSKFLPKPSRLFLVLVSSSRASFSVKAKVSVAQARRNLKDDWLASLSFPPRGLAGDNSGESASDWVIGIDPDTHGALALLKGDSSDEFSAQVFDSPHLSVLIGGKVRKRLDTKAIVEMLRTFDAPIGTTAYIEQSLPFPTDGKMGWWSGGFTYGQWLGTLVALGFSVVPVPSSAWKKKFELSGKSVTKDDSRRVASTLFPSLSSLLKRKKDHGRAEALLIAAYGQRMKMEADTAITLDESIS